MMLSVLFSGIASFFLYQNANFVAVSLLLHGRTLQLPSENFKLCTAFCRCACLHHRILYRTEKKPPSLPSPQLVEQIARVASSFLFWQIMVEKGIQVTLYCHVCYADLGDHRGSVYRNPVSAPPSVFFLKSMSVFRTQYPGNPYFFAALKVLNRVCLSLLQSAESICIPLRLQAFGLARSA